MLAKERMIVALDFPTSEQAIELVEKLGENVKVYKVGLELFLNSKGDIIDYLVEKDKKIFLDLKFHDIPNTTAMASIFAAKKNIMMFNVHASGGPKMLSEVVKKSKDINPDTLIIAVTILTSLSEEEVSRTFCSKLNLEELAINLAKLAKEANLDGVVCSPYEAKKIKENCGEDFKTICPGVRPSWAATNDQVRFMTPYEAIKNGCDYLVIGRPITKNPDPVKAANLILEEIEGGLDVSSKL